MDESKGEENLRRHVRKIPCFKCIVRVTCVDFFSDYGKVKTPDCNKFIKWVNKRDRLQSEVITSTNIVRMETLKILNEEKKRYAKNNDKKSN